MFTIAAIVTATYATMLMRLPVERRSDIVAFLEDRRVNIRRSERTTGRRSTDS